MEEQKVHEIMAGMIAKNGMELVMNGKIRNHMLKNSARIHTGEVEKTESRIYRDFLLSKNCRLVYELTGSELYE